MEHDIHTDIITDLMFGFGTIQQISKPTRISTIMNLFKNILTNNLKHPINSAIITDLISDNFKVLYCALNLFCLHLTLLNRLGT